MMKAFMIEVPLKRDSQGIATVVLVMTLAAALLYGHSLDVPWYFDDVGGIVGNPRITSLATAWSDILRPRGILNLSLAFNYHFTALGLAPLHLTNIGIHLAASTIVLLLLYRLLDGRLLPAALGALFFLAHPLQTQAVTYLIQRAASLSAFFALLAMYGYLRARDLLAAGGVRLSCAWLCPYLAALGCGFLAVFTKENTAMLPLCLVALERWSLERPRPWRTVVFEVLPFCLAPLGLGVMMLVAGGYAVGNTELVSMQANSPLHYLVTQFSVIWGYLFLLVLPIGQALDHDYPIVSKLLTWRNLLALGGLLLLGWGVWRLRAKRPLLVLGTLLFFLSLAIESSIIPLDPFFEHRLYLPLFGFTLALIGGLLSALGERGTCLLLGVAVLAFAPLTWQRNTLWRDPVVFYEDNLRQAPNSERVMINLAKEYINRGRLQEAARHLERAIEINPAMPVAYLNLAMVRDIQGERGKAAELLDLAVRRAPLEPESYENAAMMYLQWRKPEIAVAYLRQGIAVAPMQPQNYNNLGVALAALGRWHEAEAAYRSSLERRETSSQAHENLAETLLKLGRPDEALREQLRAVQLAPGEARLVLKCGRLALDLGEISLVQAMARRLLHLDPAGREQLLTEVRLRGISVEE